ncbi:MAG: hypothetical protein ABI920_10940 [Casimicrobiaceae bacterium]
MKNPSTELIYGLVIVALVLFQIGRAWLRRRTQQRAPVDDAPPLYAPPDAESFGRSRTTPPPEWAPETRVTTAPAREPPATARVARHPGRVARSLMTDRGAVRNGIVAMTVLGPCRALEPQGGDPAGGDPGGGPP